MMKNKKWDVVVFVHAILLIWAWLFITSLWIPGGKIVVGVLAIGNVFFLLINIPLSIFTLVLKAKKYFSERYETIALIFAVLNSLIGVAVWLFLILLLQKP